MLAQNVLERVPASAAVKACAYASFFEAVRASATGHALALTGLRRFGADNKALLASGDVAKLEAAAARAPSPRRTRKSTAASGAAC